MAKAHVTRMPALFRAQTEALFLALKGEPLCDANGTPILDRDGQIQWRPPGAAVLKAVNEFLKQNGIDKEPLEGADVPALTSHLKKFDDDPLLIEDDTTDSTS